MIIDAAKLKEVFPFNIRPKLDENERWYIVNHDPRYALSTFGQLAFLGDNQKWKNIKRTYYCGGDAYYVKWAHNSEGEYIKVETLIKDVFFAGVPNIWRIIPCPEYPSNGKWTYSHRWSFDVLKCHILFSEEDHIEYLKSKLKHKHPEYSSDQYTHRFINRDETISILKFNRDRHNMLQRSTGEKRKKARPDNIKNSVCAEWLDRDTFADWYLSNRYIYTGKYGSLQLDKDLLNSGKTSIYSPEYCCFLPATINDTIRPGYRNRHKQLKKIAKIITEEKPRGEIPGFIIDALERWIDTFGEEVGA